MSLSITIGMRRFELQLAGAVKNAAKATGHQTTRLTASGFFLGVLFAFEFLALLQLDSRAHVLPIHCARSSSLRLAKNSNALSTRVNVDNL